MNRISRYALGCYTDRPNAPNPGKGIGFLELDEELGLLREIGLFEDVINPSYLWFRADKKTGTGQLFAATETDNSLGRISSFRYRPEGKLEQVSRAEGSGRANCHVNVSPEGNLAFAASYGDGHLKVYAIRDNIIEKVLLDYAYQGSGPNEKRQEGSHAHQAVLSPDGKYLYVVDLGTDGVWIHNLERLEETPRKVATPPGLGPRHMAFHPETNRAYLLCELIPTALVFEWDSRTGELDLVQQTDTVLEKDKTLAQPAAIKIHPSGKTLAVSNRFADSVTVFSIDPNSGLLNREDIFGSRGKVCRDMEFSPSGEWLLMAHQDSSDIQLRRFDSASGLPRTTWGEGFGTGTPTCLVNIS